MGYLGEAIATAKAERRAAGVPIEALAWDERHGTEWLLGAPERFADQRAVMVAALRERLAALSDRLDPAAIARGLTALEAVPREHFVCPLIEDLAYLPAALDIGLGQTISHPEMVAVLAAAADPQGGAVLDVGTGSGYQAAVLAQMAAQVTSVEIVAPHASLARARLARLGCDHVSVIEGDATVDGLFPTAHFDAIVVAAAADRVPPALLTALKPGGRLVMPLGPNRDEDHLVLVERSGDSWRHTRLCAARFVPLTGTAAPAR